MPKCVYRERRTFEKYDPTHIIGYLNETVVKDYLPDNIEGEEQTPYDGYQYEGTENDGGTIMDCSNPNDRGELINAIIRSRYSQSEELAIHRHVTDDAATYADEWKEYDTFCESAKEIVDGWLS